MLIDSKLLQKLNDWGYCVIPNFIDKQIIADIKKMIDELDYKQFDGVGSIGYYSNPNILPQHINQRVNEFLINQSKNDISKHFLNYEIGGGILLLKGKGEKEVLLHQDWNIVDETRYQSLAIWIPLIDVNNENGCLEVLPGSHRWFNNFRSPTMQAVYLPLKDYKRFSKSVPLNAGDALVFSHKLFHGSKSNKIDHTRAAICMSLIESSSRQVFYHHKDNLVHEICAENQFFTTKLNDVLNGDLKNANILSSQPFSNNMLLTKEGFDKVFQKKKVKLLIHKYLTNIV
jgi:ectoine hydroxylase-related dioxygenase (phytanoyl-CoA dioxygenase family)